MLRILVLNAKGGCGKTTVATNLASLYAKCGYATALFDCDAQSSSLRWLRLRGEEMPVIYGVAAHQQGPMNVTRTWQLRVPTETQRIIVDAPGGLKNHELAAQVQNVDVILVPVVPSPIDTFATADFIRDLLLVGKVRTPETRIGIVANRVKANTLAFRSLQHFLDRLHIPVVAHLRDTQHYLQAVERGVGVHELDAPRALKDRVPWQEMLRWVEGIGSPKFALVPPPKAIPDSGASRAARAQSPARGNP